MKTKNTEIRYITEFFTDDENIILNKEFSITMNIGEKILYNNVSYKIIDKINIIDNYDSFLIKTKYKLISLTGDGNYKFL